MVDKGDGNMKKLISLSLICLLILAIFISNITYAADSLDEIIGKMEDVGNASDLADSSGTAKVINDVIGIIQLAGTGISVIVISLLGIKYLIASPGEKADVKKNIMPIVIGCILLFAAVNIIGMVENFTNQLNFGS